MMADDDSATCAAVEALLQAPLPAVTLDEAALRRCRVASLVYGVLTQGGRDDGALAPLLLSGACDALESYVYGEGDGETCTQSSSGPALVRYAAPPSHAAFVRDCLLPNQPAVFPFDAAEPLFRHCAPWVREGRPDVHAVAAAFPGGTSVTVADCSSPEQPRTKMTLRQLAAWYTESAEQQQLYLRNLHLVAASPRFRYRAPALFSSDWPNTCHDEGMRDAPDLRFVYLGKAGTCTPTHMDVLNTYSWSASLCGAKRWQMFPPESTHLLLDRWGRAGAAWPRDDACSHLLWPRAHSAPCLEFTQRAGEVVFVPSGWRHNVVNLEDALSVNANWFNAANVHWVAHHVLVEEPNDSDCADSAAHRLANVLHCIGERCVQRCNARFFALVAPDMPTTTQGTC